MSNSALVIVDMLNDFMRGGSLAVPDAESIIDNVNTLSNHFRKVVAVQDWHPADHCSFASINGVEPFTMKDGEMKWPMHCVAGTYGSQFCVALNMKKIRAIFRKGVDSSIESYSGAYDSQNNSNGLVEFLESQDVDDVYVCGLALDYCVGETAKHLADMSFNTIIVRDATKSVVPNFNFSDYKGISFLTTAEAMLR